MQRLILLGLLMFGALTIATVEPALAVDLGQQALETAAGSGGAGFNTSRTAPQVIGSIIQVIIGLLGIVFLLLVIYAGVLWMTSAGDSKQVEKAKGILSTAVIGLVITLSAYAISEFVIDQLINATGTGQGPIAAPGADTGIVPQDVTPTD